MFAPWFLFFFTTTLIFHIIFEFHDNIPMIFSMLCTIVSLFFLSLFSFFLISPHFHFWLRADLIHAASMLVEAHWPTTGRGPCWGLSGICCWPTCLLPSAFSLMTHFLRVQLDFFSISPSFSHRTIFIFQLFLSVFFWRLRRFLLALFWFPKHKLHLLVTPMDWAKCLIPHCIGIHAHTQVPQDVRTSVGSPKSRVGQEWTSWAARDQNTALLRKQWAPAAV